MARRTVTQIKLSGLDFLQSQLDNGGDFHEFDHKTHLGFFYHGPVKAWGYSFAGIKKVTGLQNIAKKELKQLIS